MTKRDLELVADAVASIEEAYPDAALAVTVALANRIERDHPRFKRGLFEIACLPHRNAALKAAILAKFSTPTPTP